MEEIIKQSIEYGGIIVGNYVRDVCIREKLNLQTKQMKNINFFFTDNIKYKRFISTIKSNSISSFKKSKNEYTLYYTFQSSNFKVLVTFSDKAALPLDFEESSLVYKNGNTLDVINTHDKEKIIRNIILKVLTITPEYCDILKEEAKKNESHTKIRYVEELINEGWTIIWDDGSFVKTHSHLRKKLYSEQSFFNGTKILIFLGFTSLISLLYFQH